MTTWSPMDVEIINDDNGSHPEPGFDPQWSVMDRLRWHAGIIKARSGVTVEFHDGAEASGPGYHFAYPELIGVTVRGDGWVRSHSEHRDTIGRFLRGLEVGASAATRLAATHA
ncbi:hypothetical protein E2F47_06140 [Mycobacterium eburneum]|nr:hypothetical protein [Mycobacterium eburneum]TDH56707.1 hypothetical protein E2F47_06140 [Mycobacterium eburneum]